MTDSRTRILEGIRRAHGRGALPADRQAEIDARVSQHPSGIVPARAAVEHEAALDLFTEMVVASAATIDRVTSWGDVATSVSDYLKGRNLPATLAVAPDPRLDALDAQPLLTVRRGPALPQDVVGVTVAFAGIAEVGSVLLTSGPNTPTSLNFLPDVAIIAVDARTVHGSYEEAWARIRAAYPQNLPRTLNLVTGPSRTGDIEQTIQLGAHGPRQLHVVLVDEPRT